MNDLSLAFRDARLAAERHMETMDVAGDSWHETTITDIVLTQVYPHATFARFNQRQEGTTGADWLWWWVDASGEAFGMLVQAKRLRIAKRWTIDFTYPGDGAQRKKLFATAQELDVPPVYALYLGTQAYRVPSTCGRPDHDDDCDWCRAATISFLPSILGTTGGGANGDSAEFAVENSIALEHLVNHTARSQAHDVNSHSLHPDLRDFLLSPQNGARQIAKVLFERVSAVRSMQFSATIGDTRVIDGTHVFSEYPADTGHFGFPYFPHILRGLRQSPPSYVLDMLTDREDDPQVSEQVAGVAVFRI